MKPILILAGILGIALAASAPTASAATDCKAAKTPVEKAICADPRAHKADAEVSAALAVLTKLSTPEEAAGWSGNQSAWLADRDLKCSYDGDTSTPAKPSSVAECVVNELAARDWFLEGWPDEGPGQSSRIMPVILKGPNGDNFSLRFATPKTPGENLLNKLLDDQIAKLHLTDPDYSDYLRVNLKYASPTLLSAEVLGGADRRNDADPANDGYFDYNLNLDMRAGKALSFADAFPPEMLPKLQKLCATERKDYLMPTPGETAVEVAANKAHLDATVADLGQWSFGAKEASVTMDPGDEGPYVCHFGYGYLRKIIKPGFPLPR